MLSAEPMALWEEESPYLAALWETWEAVRDLSTPGMPATERLRAESFLQDRVLWRSPKVVLFFWPEPLQRQEVIASQAVPEGPAVLARWNQGDTLKPARYFVHKEVNRCLLGHVVMAVLPFLRSRIRFVPDTLRTALYMHCAFELARTVGEQRMCENLRCPQGGVFFPTRRDQRHCDKRCRELAGYHRRRKTKA